MMRLGEINPLDVEGTEASTNLETAGYESLRPFLRWVPQHQCANDERQWDRAIRHPLAMLRVMPAVFPVTVDHFGNSHGRFHGFSQLDHFRHQVLTSEIDLFFCWDGMCRVIATRLHHTQCFAMGVLCVNIQQSLLRFPIHSARRRLWGSLLIVISNLVCREQRFRWGYGTTRQYSRIIRRLIWEANDFALFHIPIVIRNILRDQVVESTLTCTAARLAQYDALGIVAV